MGRYTRPHKEEIIKKAMLRDGDDILDVACGNGYLLGEIFKKARVNAFGVDISENMIASARERYPVCTFAASSCTPLSFKNECMRVLKKSGKVLIAEPFFTPVVRWLANTVVFPFSKTGEWN